MALIKCPECGREKVSDTAEMCPDCGYGIKAHFEAIKHAEEEKKKREILDKQRAEENRKKEIKKQRDLETIKLPDAPDISPVIGYTIGAVFFVVMGIILIVLKSGFMSFVSFVFGGMMILVIPSAYDDYKKKKKEYEFAIENQERYKQMELERKERIEELRIRAVNLEAQKWLDRPKCPHCKSDKIEKITTTSRVVSVAMVGVASGKIGKQYKCKDCKHMW